MIDTHAHLSWSDFDADLSAVLERAKDAGVSRVITVALDKETGRKCLEIAAAHPDMVAATIGVHPSEVEHTTEDDLLWIEAQAGDQRVVAIGEIEPGIRLVQPVVGLLRSSDATIRKTAVQALLQVDASQSIPALVAAGRDSDAEVRQGIVAAVGEWGGSAASPWLRERLAEDPASGVRAEAAYRLGLLSDSDSRAALESTIVKDPDSGVRRWAKRGF